MQTEHQLERLNDAHQEYLRAEAAMVADLSGPNVQRQIGAFNRMYDMALACGMDLGEPEVGEWVACRVTRWLVEA